MAFEETFLRKIFSIFTMNTTLLSNSQSESATFLETVKARKTEKDSNRNLLTPGQQSTLHLLRTVINAVPITVLEGERGLGKTTVLQQISQELNACLISLRDISDAIVIRHPHAMEEAICSVLDESFRHHNIVVWDDIDYLSVITTGYGYPRPGFFHAVLKSIMERVKTSGHKLILSLAKADHVYQVVSEHSIRVTLPEFGAEDYGVILMHVLGVDSVKQLDLSRIFRFAAKLTGYQLTAVARLLIEQGNTKPTTDEVVKCIDQYLLTSNTHTAEVAPIAFADLKGAEELIEKLERTILLPMQDSKRAAKLGLKPKRGVLLHGDPGTGKTSIGRALAHQMKGKFFIIDGTFIQDASGFFRKVQEVFANAKANSPSVIFVDDADVLFKSDNHGLARYLLTMLDGLEGESLGNVCVMMTAMNIADMPPALLRSGRVEVWLETKLPNAEARLEILRHYMNGLSEQHQLTDPAALVELTEGFTPADLRRIIGDAKALLAYDDSKGREIKLFQGYLVKAAQEVTELKQKLATSLGDVPKSYNLANSSSN